MQQDQQSLADALVRSGVATQPQVDRLLQEQARYAARGQSVSLGDLAVQFNLATRDQLRALAQSGTGETIGPYQILEEIGRGSAGIVYKVTKPGLVEPLALKAILLGDSKHAERIAKRFQNEAEAGRDLVHPNIINVHETGYDGRYLYYTMDLVFGRPMSEYCPKNSPALDIPFMIRTLIDVAEAVAYAHDEGVIHRDLKLSNVIVSENGPLLADFGLAKSNQSRSVTKTGDIMGTPYYMAPEIARGDAKKADERSDIWSLGVMFYRIVVGHYPFMALSPIEIMEAIVDNELRFPDTDEANETFRRICLKAMAKHPDDRYRSARDFAGDLQSYLDGESVSGPPKWRKVKRAVFGNKLVLIGLILFLAAIGTLIGIITGT